MSVIVRGTEMPKNCALCKFRGAGETWCPFTSREVPGNTIPEDCPLGHVPPHGRLIDADALAQLFKEKATEHGGIGGIMVAMAAGCIDAAPTIIPAEEETP